MLLRFLGSAAGGGFPQWNCGCATCCLGRRADQAISRRTSCSLAISSGDDRWFLVNVAAELSTQVAACPSLCPPPGTRDSPIQGVILTDAELDHALGLLAMRYASRLDVYGTPTVRDLLDAAGLSTILAAYVELRWHDVEPGVSFGLAGRDGSNSGLRCEAVPLGTGRVPRYAIAGPPSTDRDWLAAAVVAYRVTSTRDGSTALLMPTAPRVPPELLEKAGDLLVLDGTFWSAEELSQPGHTAGNLGHVPMSGSSGTLATLRQAQRVGRRRPQVVYTHLNNTNPVLADAVLRQTLSDTGAEVAHDGMEIRLGTGSSD